MSAQRQHLKRALAEVLGRTGALNLSRQLRERWLGRPRLTILCYHRIAEAGALLSPQCVPAALFDTQVGYFARHLRVLPLSDVEAYLQGRLTLDRDAVVITFDDGYKDNRDQALPILDRHGVKATFFLTSTPVLDGRPIWIDELASLLEPLHGQPQALQAPLLPAAGPCIEAFMRASQAEKAPRAAAVFRVLNSLSEDEKSRVLAALRKMIADAGRAPAESPALMTPEDVDALLRSGHQVGVHTQHHARLALLGPAAVDSEIRVACERLRARFGAVPHFAYPFGKPEDLPQDSASLRAVLSACGFGLAVTTSDRAVSRRDDRFLVPRKVVSPQSLSQLRLKLEMLSWAR